ncbi:unnamed protein product [Protopolystoma xenopodis]|uniref:Uncharacterized protein n=1 Tax=Protopolystoma xenopodis TaxID=117903 RepID=A0A3S5BF42_9PLAT|nr:unnamed protein product [Protopolystoma xenopodis]
MRDLLCGCGLLSLSRRRLAVLSRLGQRRQFSAGEIGKTHEAGVATESVPRRRSDSGHCLRRATAAEWMSRWPTHAKMGQLIAISCLHRESRPRISSIRHAKLAASQQSRSVCL